MPLSATVIPAQGGRRHAQGAVWCLLAEPAALLEELYKQIWAAMVDYVAYSTGYGKETYFPISRLGEQWEIAYAMQ